MRMAKANASLQAPTRDGVEGGRCAQHLAPATPDVTLAVVGFTLAGTLVVQLRATGCGCDERRGRSGTF
jgi:hypothetical protein